MKCKNCGAKINEGDLFCGSRGEKIEAAAEEKAVEEKAVVGIFDKSNFNVNSITFIKIFVSFKFNGDRIWFYLG